MLYWTKGNPVYTEQTTALIALSVESRESETRIAAAWGFTLDQWNALTWQDRADYRDRIEFARPVNLADFPRFEQPSLF